ncbi:hypothetical protein BC941DRAFT_340704, partial [Chlamydoabsidia padenii]
LLKDLKFILMEKDLDEFHQKVHKFFEEYNGSGADPFLDYMEKVWFANDEVISRWSSACLPVQYHVMATNNYIESWHNQLKTKHLKSERNRRLDRLVFILTNNVEKFFLAESERIALNSGRMGPL